MVMQRLLLIIRVRRRWILVRIVCWFITLSHNFFIEDCMVSYAHQFYFNPHTHDQGFGEIPLGIPPVLGFDHTIEFGLPRIDEMMDELHGVVYISEIELRLTYHHKWMGEKVVEVHHEKIQFIWYWLT
jgi:hypothetical protein